MVTPPSVGAAPRMARSRDCRSGGGEADDEAAAAVDVGHGYPAAVGFDQAADDGQAETAAAAGVHGAVVHDARVDCAGGAGRFAAEGDVEDAGEVGFGDTAAGVG